jgi:hypothetical protein
MSQNELRLETVRKGLRVTLRACIWPAYGAKTGRTGRFWCFVGSRFGHLRDFSDSFLTAFSEVGQRTACPAERDLGLQSDIEEVQQVRAQTS